ncbi:hypothetical protein Tsubulata_021619 [Turnera subulata]|uniref:Exocyst subunit Exo70 family protein n=1 Tax=Turnera subulata TaxID=218843 RepID=A0A9Q0JFK1_9ROSI|nr:hypothetical protein Tsubulata_021619 [Turnera subulata]
MGEDKDRNGNVVAARDLLRSSLESSRALASAMDISGKKLEGINQRLSSLETAIRPIPVQMQRFQSIHGHIDHATGPAAAVLRVYHTLQELEESLLSNSCSELFEYLLLVKQIEETFKFLAQNCGLALRWLEDIVQFLEDNHISDGLYAININKACRILQELQATQEQARLPGGLLFAAFEKLETEFKQLLSENCSPIALDPLSSSTVDQSCITASPLPSGVVIHKLQAIVSRLSTVDWLDKCLSSYVEVRILNARRSLQVLDLDYLERTITESDNVQDIEVCIDQWCKHLDLAMKHVFEVEYKLCRDVFEKMGPDFCEGCFAKIASEPGILSFLKFGKEITQCKNDPLKLLKLLDIFAALDNLRMEFNRLFGGAACTEIQTMTRDLVRSVVDGACEIFWELPVQVELQRLTSPPSDGSVPRLVIFVTDYCNRLLGDDYRPLLAQVLGIHRSWKKEKYQEDLLTDQVCSILKEIGLNLDAWSKAYEDTTLSYLFMMNNHCHFSKLKGTKLGELMGESCLEGHQQYRDNYMMLHLRETWGKVFALLSQETRTLSSPTRRSAGDLVKRRLKEFNEAFDAMYEKQSNWVVPNEDIRWKMCKLTIHAFVPGYRSYLKACSLPAEQNVSPGKHVKYTEQDLETMLSSLFEPKPRKSGSSSPKPTRLIGKIRNIVTDNFRMTLMAV